MARSDGRILAAFGGAALVALALVACNGILGLDEYERVECTGRVCDGGGTVDVGFDDGGTDGGPGDGGKGADPVSWARWPMPNYKVDGGALPNEPALTVAGDEVTDTITRLVWRRLPATQSSLESLEAAKSACDAIGAPGDWRLPKRIELVTLLDYGHDKPFIDTTKFDKDFPPIRMWTLSEVRPFTGGSEQKYWVVNFDTGAVEQERGVDRRAGALCVKAR